MFHFLVQVVLTFFGTAVLKVNQYAAGILRMRTLSSGPLPPFSAPASGASSSSVFSSVPSPSFSDIVEGLSPPSTSTASWALSSPAKELVLYRGKPTPSMAWDTASARAILLSATLLLVVVFFIVRVCRYSSGSTQAQDARILLAEMKKKNALLEARMEEKDNEMLAAATALNTVLNKIEATHFDQRTRAQALEGELKANTKDLEGKLQALRLQHNELREEFVVAKDSKMCDDLLEEEMPLIGLYEAVRKELSRVAEENRQLETLADELEDDVDKATVQNGELTVKLGETITQNGELKATLDRTTVHNGELTIELGKTTAQNDELKASLDRTTVQNGELTVRLGETTTQNDELRATLDRTTVRNGELTVELGKTTAQNDELKASLDGPTIQEHEHLLQVLGDRTAEIHHLNRCLDAADRKDDIASSLRKEVSELTVKHGLALETLKQTKADAGRLQASITELAAAHKAAQSSLEVASEDLREVQESARHSAHSLVVAERQLDVARKAAEVETGNLEKAQADTRAALAEVSVLKDAEAKASSLKASSDASFMAALEKVNAEVEGLRVRNATLDQIIQELQSSSEADKSDQAEIENLSAANSRLVETVRALELAQAATSHELSEARGQTKVAEENLRSLEVVAELEHERVLKERVDATRMAAEQRHDEIVAGIRAEHQAVLNKTVGDVQAAADVFHNAAVRDLNVKLAAAKRSMEHVQTHAAKNRKTLVDQREQLLEACESRADEISSLKAFVASLTRQRTELWRQLQETEGVRDEDREAAFDADLSYQLNVALGLEDDDSAEASVTDDEAESTLPRPATAEQPSAAAPARDWIGVGTSHQAADQDPTLMMSGGRTGHAGPEAHGTSMQQTAPATSAEFDFIVAKPGSTSAAPAPSAEHAGGSMPDASAFPATAPTGEDVSVGRSVSPTRPIKAARSRLGRPDLPGTQTSAAAPPGNKFNFPAPVPLSAGAESSSESEEE